MHRTGLLLAVTATALLTSSGVAAASGTTPPDQPPITLTAEQSARICQQHIPRMLDRLARLETRIAADAGTVGSTAWLTERIERAETLGRTDWAEQLRERVERRTTLPDRIEEIESRIVGFRDANCVS